MQLTLYRQHYRSLLQLGLPIMVGQLGTIILGFADTLMVGHYGTNELAAASFVNNMFNLVIVFSTGFSYGLTPIVGQLYGQNKPIQIGQTLKNGLAANSVIALLLMLIMTVLYLNIHRLNQPVDLLPLMRPYYLVLLVSLIFVLLFNAFKQFAEGITDTQTPMWILLGGNLVNIIGNWLLIFGKWGCPELGLLGAGISTLLSRIIMVITFIIIFLTAKRYRTYKEGFLQERLNKDSFTQLNKLGWPVGLQMGMETASFSLSTIMVGWLGKTALAAHQVMLTVGLLGFMLYYGMAAAVAVRISYFKGQNDWGNIKNTASAGFHLILLLAIMVSVPLFLLRHHIGYLFSSDTDVVLLAAQLVLPFILYQLGDGLQCNFSNSLRGIADVKPVMLFAFIAYFVISLPVGYLFGFVFDWGLTGIWLSYPFGLTSAGLMFYARFKSKTKSATETPANNGQAPLCHNRHEE